MGEQRGKQVAGRGHSAPPQAVRTGRGAVSNPAGRFESRSVEAIDDGWSVRSVDVDEPCHDAPRDYEPCDEPFDGEPLPPLATTVQIEAARSIITRNDSPDVPFTQSINPYRGCEHGCIYCFARPTHSYFNLSPGLDFETRLFYKPDAVRLLQAELAKPGYRCQTIALGTNTDPYQPIEKQHRLMRGILELLDQCQHPVSIVTKGTLIERDLDLLARLASRQLVHVGISVTTLRNDLKRTLEPRAAAPAARLRVIRSLTDAGVPVTVMVAPVIPLLTDGELEHILEAGAEAGAKQASYLLLRLPFEVRQLFRDWLNAHEPLKAQHILSLLNQMRGGKDNDPRFDFRQRGLGVYADLLARRFAATCTRLGLNHGERHVLDSTRFVPPVPSSGQLALF